MKCVEHRSVFDLFTNSGACNVFDCAVVKYCIDSSVECGSRVRRNAMEDLGPDPDWAEVCFFVLVVW